MTAIYDLKGYNKCLLAGLNLPMNNNYSSDSACLFDILVLDYTPEGVCAHINLMAMSQIYHVYG